MIRSSCPRSAQSTLHQGIARPSIRVVKRDVSICSCRPRPSSVASGSQAILSGPVQKDVRPIAEIAANIVAMLGGWSIVAPFVFGYHTTVEMARNTDIVVGIAVAVIALVSHFYGSPVMRQRVTA